MKTIEINSRYFIYQHRHGLLVAISRLIDVMEYNLLNYDLMELQPNIVNTITSTEAGLIIDFIGYEAGIKNVNSLVDELQQETEIDLSPQNVLFIMVSQADNIRFQLKIDEDTSLHLYKKLHISLAVDDLMDLMKEFLVDSENNAFYERRMLS